MKETFLERIIAVTRERVEVQKRTTGPGEMRKRAFSARSEIESGRLSRALARKERINIIAEIKRASPSKGVINDDIDVEQTSRMYEQSGACAISVLTEQQFFMGSIDDLRQARAAVDIPILRKDFIIDEFQIYEAAAAEADAILLIVAALSYRDLERFKKVAQEELGMDVLVEVHTLEELEIAAEICVHLVGVNNRDLRSFDVSLDVSRELIKHRPANCLMIAESGISSRVQIDELKALGFDGFLIGESLMRDSSAEKLVELAS